MLLTSASVPEVMDISRESARTLAQYGAQPGAASFANNCLLARRLVEQGVRFVQLHDWGWDFHGTNAGEDIGNGLVTKNPDSPHLLIAKTNATYLVCQAQNDDAQQPTVKDDLKTAFTAANKTASVEVYHADHGWCVPGSAVYNQGEAERAWSNLGRLYKTQLA